MAMPTIVHLTLWFGGGILLATGAILHPVWTIAAIALVLLGVIMGDTRTRLIAIALPNGLILLAAGATLGYLAIQQRQSDCRSTLRAHANNRATAVLLQQPVRNSAPIRFETINERPCSRLARALLPAAASRLAAGTRVQLRGEWWPDPPTDPLDPHSGLLVVRSAQQLPGTDRTAALRGAVVSDIRELFGDQAPLAEALLVAQRDGIDPKVKRDFAASGLAHLLAISGTHVALVAAMVVLIGALLRWPTLISLGAGCVIAVLYVLFLGAPYPAVRAALQLLLVLLARVLQRPAHNFALLAAAAGAILLWDPLALLDAGFQLSFAGLIGIFVWRQPLIDAMPESIPLVLRDAVATSTAASLATTPIAAFHFGQVSLIAVPANLFAVPVVTVAVPAAAVAVMLNRVLPIAASFLADGTRLLLARLEQVAAIAAATPGGHFYVARTTVLAAFAIFCIAWWLASPRLRAPVRYAVVSAITIAVLPLIAAVFSTTDRQSIEVHAIDVGQGDAIAIRSPRGRWALIDAGPRSERYDAGQSRVLPFLLRSGVRELELMVLTHPHLDHVGGALAVARSLPPAYLIDPDSARNAQGALDSLGRHIRKQWLPARPGTRLTIDSMRIEVLYPDATSLDGSMDPNDNSVVVRLAYGRFVALFTGDAPAWVEELLISQSHNLDADVVKAGHHGSTTSTSQAWLEVTTPSFALVSAGRGNRYGHPAAEVLDRLQRAGVPALRTDREGTISLRAFADGRIERMRN